MTDRTIDQADLEFVVKMTKKKVLVIDVAPPELYGKKSSIIVCCSEYVADEQFPKGSVVIAVLGGAIHLIETHSMDDDSEAVATFLRHQIKVAQENNPDFSVNLIVDVPCIGLDVDGPLDVVQQINSMVCGMEIIDLNPGTEVSCFLRVNTGAGGTFYKIDKNRWRQWFTTYEISVLDLLNDDDPGADDGLGPNDMATGGYKDTGFGARPVVIDPATGEGDFNEDGSLRNPSGTTDTDSDAMEAFRESQYDVTDDPSRRKG